MRIIFIVLVFQSLFVSCQKDSMTKIANARFDECQQIANDKGFTFEREGKTLLYGGENENWHFDITAWSLRECQLNYGLGREYFAALINPGYETAGSIHDQYDADERAILLETNEVMKVYPLSLLRKHEVINEEADGQPIMVAYCILADLAAVYSRTYCDTTFTFALSGYTYRDPEVWNGTNAFVLWDRETESLWWPLIDKAVSGKMKDTGLQKHNQEKWREVTWAEVMTDFPEALVLKKGQSMEAPINWPRYENLECFQ